MSEIKTLPFFRIGGLQTEFAAAPQAEQLKQCWQDAVSGSLNGLTAFSKTLYCVFDKHQDNGGCRLTIGRLISTDTELAEPFADVWIKPQQYQVQTLPEQTDAAAVWATLSAIDNTERSFHADFASFPAIGSATLYVGLNGKVEIEEVYE